MGHVLLLCITQVAYSDEQGVKNADTTSGIPQLARKVVLLHRLTGNSVTLETEPTQPSATLP